MSEQKTKKVKAPKVDRWGFDLPPPGWVRGRAMNLRRSEDVSQYGPVQVLDFELSADDNIPPIPVRMTATDFQGRVVEDSIYQVEDPDPSVRPLTPWRVCYAHNPDEVVIAHFPGREFEFKEKGLAWTVMLVAAPFLGFAVIAGLCAYYFGWFH